VETTVIARYEWFQELVAEVVKFSLLSFKQEVRTVFNKKFVMLFVVTTIVTFAFYTAEAQEVVKKGLVSYWSFDSIVGKTVADNFGDNDAIIRI